MISSRTGAAVATGGVGEGGDAKIDSGRAAGGDLVHLSEFVVGAGEADFQSFGLAEPAVRFGFGDAVQEVVADLGQAAAFGGVRPEQWATQAAVLVDTGGRVGPAAVADGDLPAFEVAEELGPFVVAGGAVYRAVARGGGRRMPGAR